MYTTFRSTGRSCIGRPAAYELTIGDEYFLNGEFHTLDLQNGDETIIRIPPFEVAVLKTTEILSLPRYLIARWNIRVRHAYSGLLWVGGPQVDPGYVGHLFCPIYNLSDRAVVLHVGEPIAVIDFIKTTPFRKTMSKEYRFPPQRWVMEDYGIDNLRSALYTTAGQKLREFEEEIRAQATRITGFFSLSFGLFGILIALGALLSRTNAENLTLAASVWGGGIVAISVAAFLIAISSRLSHRVGQIVYELYGKVMAERAKAGMNFLRRAWYIGFATSIFVAIAIGFGIYLETKPVLSDLRQQRVLAKAESDKLSVSTSADIHKLTDRLAHLERERIATLDDLEKLKSVLEQEIEAVRRPMHERPVLLNVVYKTRTEG